MIGAAGGGALLLAVAAFAAFGGGGPDAEGLILHTVERGPLKFTVRQRGTLESAENRDIVCLVKTGKKSATNIDIKWVIEDGSLVKRGDNLIKLNDSALQEEKTQQENIVAQAKLAREQAEEELKIVRAQNAADVAKAQSDIEIAAINLEKYCGLERGSLCKMTLEQVQALDLTDVQPKEGEYRQLMDEVQGRLKLAEANLELALDRYSFTRRMVKKGYMSPSQAQADESKLQSSQEELRKTKTEALVLEKYTKPQKIIELKSLLEEAVRALSRVKAQAKATEAKARGDLLTKIALYQKEAATLDEIDQQIDHCIITAPQEGMVVYYVPRQVRFGGGSQQSIVAQGERVREGQKLMQLPDLSRMQVELEVHESMVMNLEADEYERRGVSASIRRRLQALMTAPGFGFAAPAVPPSLDEVREAYQAEDLVLKKSGQRATIRIDAFPDRVYRGHVKSVATVATQNYFQPEIKKFKTVVVIDPEGRDPEEVRREMSGLRPGMSADVTIEVKATKESVLLLPVQAVMGDARMGGTRKVLVADGGETSERDVTLGASNEMHVEILGGLEPGETVVLNPAKVVGDKYKTRAEVKSAAGGKKGGKPRRKG